MPFDLGRGGESATIVARKASARSIDAILGREDVAGSDRDDAVAGHLVPGCDCETEIFRGLQAVLDEFVHLVWDLRALGRLADPHQRSAELARVFRLVTSARSVQVAPDEIVVSGRKVEFKRHTMRTRFAVRYGETEDESTGERTPAEATRDAFNSPFAPFILATTSVGQEGLDFHAYCHAVVHWNLPSNPVDLEQREGRVHRYKGHAVRKNVVDAVGERSLLRDDTDPWAALFAEAEAGDQTAIDSESRSVLGLPRASTDRAARTGAAA